jgi:hypothetical protein
MQSWEEVHRIICFHKWCPSAWAHHCLWGACVREAEPAPVFKSAIVTRKASANPESAGAGVSLLHNPKLRHVAKSFVDLL